MQFAQAEATWDFADFFCCTALIVFIAAAAAIVAALSPSPPMSVPSSDARANCGGVGYRCMFPGISTKDSVRGETDSRAPES